MNGNFALDASNVPAADSLCRRCQHVRTVSNSRGSVFLLCQLALNDPRFPKYPPQPVVRCSGYSSVPAIEA
jgi:hypothetical protein